MANPLNAAIFPGQGSQSVGMGRELVEQFPVARDTFAEADAVLGLPLSTIIFEGPADELKRTSIAQPALVTMSTAYWRVLAGRGIHFSAFAGHSLGEYSALVAAGSLSFADGVRLVRARGELMELAATEHPGGMAAVLGQDDENVRALCAEVAAEHGALAPANYNSPGQVVVSGESAAIAALRTLAKSRGIRVIPLAVSGAFHSPLMQAAADAFLNVLNDVGIAPPSMPVVPNVTAAATTDPAVIRHALAQQITGAVQWVRSLQVMQEMGVHRFIEVGPGNVLTGLVTRTLSDIEAVTVADVLAQ